MKQVTNNPFLNVLPSLDLHGEITAIAPNLINEFLHDCLKLKSYKVIIIHGHGTGALQKATHEFLKKDKRVKKYYIDGSNDGCTIIELEKRT